MISVWCSVVEIVSVILSFDFNLVGIGEDKRGVRVCFWIKVIVYIWGLRKF